MVALSRGPHSYTGQDVSELHTLGAPPLLGLVLAGCLSRGARHAQPGEFTLRAFLCGRIDLTGAEAVLGVIDARNQAQLDAALQQLAGGLSGPILTLRDRLLDLLSHLEANLDFADEPDVDPLSRAQLTGELAAAAVAIGTLTARLSRRDRTASRPKVVLIGRPNAGKSRLFNALVRDDHALVSPCAGTTRDYLTAICPCDGLTVELVDTAGVETPQGPIESQAQTLRDEQAGQADLLLLCSAADRGPDATTMPQIDTSILWIRTKCDLEPLDGEDSEGMIRTSAETGEGLDLLRSAIASTLREQDSDGDLPASTAARCRDSLVRASQSVSAAAHTIVRGGGDELVAFELRLALDELGKVVGAVVTDDILDRIFQKFCIGK
jgi:tRNA modification GTPase